MLGADQPRKLPPTGGSVLLRHVRARAGHSQAPAAARGRAEAPAPPPPPGSRSPERAIAAAIARAANRLHDLPLFFDRIVTSHAVLGEVAELLPDQALVSVIEGPGEALGTIALCRGLVTSLIEMQATGRVSSHPAATRRPTRTDSAICADFMNGCLAELAAEHAQRTGIDSFGSYRYAGFLDDPRPLDLLLDDVGYRHISVDVRAGPGGQRDGRMVIILPLEEAIVTPSPPAAGSDVHPEDPSVARGATLANAVHAAPIELVGILCRRSLSLGQLRALSPGDLITLPPGAIASATLETTLGQRVFGGRLGELSGNHALRLTARLPDADATMDDTPTRDGPAPHGRWTDAAADHPVPGAETSAAVIDGMDFSPIQPLETPGEPPIGDLASPDPFRHSLLSLESSSESDGEEAPMAGQDPDFTGQPAFVPDLASTGLG